MARLSLRASAAAVLLAVVALSVTATATAGFTRAIKAHPGDRGTPVSDGKHAARRSAAAARAGNGTKCGRIPDAAQCRATKGCDYCIDRSNTGRGQCFDPAVVSCCSLWTDDCTQPVLCDAKSEGCCTPSFGCEYGGGPTCCKKDQTCCSSRHDARCCDKGSKCCWNSFYGSCCPADAECCGVGQGGFPFCCGNGTKCSVSGNSCVPQ